MKPQQLEKRGSTPRMDVLIDNLPGNVYRRVRRPDGSYMFEYLSNGLFRQFGIDHERLLAEHEIRFDWIHPDDRDRMMADLEVSATMLTLLDHRVRVIGHDGAVHWARGIARPTRRADGCVVWDGIVIDVSREVGAEAGLRVAKEEADRALATAAAIVAGAAARLSAPLQELGNLLDQSAVDTGNDVLLTNLRRCHENLTRALAGLGSGLVVSERDQQRESLTRRQVEVLRLVALGLSNKRIAQRLGISPGTAKLHVAAVLRVMGARNRHQLIPACSDIQRD